VVLRRVFFIFGCCGVAWACWYYMLWYHYYDILPRSPQPSIGRIYPINMHGFTKYATRKELRHIDTTEDIFFAWIAIGLLVGGIFNKDLLAKGDDKKWPSGSSMPP